MQLSPLLAVLTMFAAFVVAGFGAFVASCIPEWKRRMKAEAEMEAEMIIRLLAPPSGGTAAHRPPTATSPEREAA